MINVFIDHSYEEDYFMIDRIIVNLDDNKEKARIENLAKQLEGEFVEAANNLLNKRIANFLEVDVSLIDLDTNEID